MEVTSEGEFVVGRLDGSTDARLEAVRDMLNAAASTRISTNIMGELYSKLIVNSCINSLGVIAGVPLGQLLAVKKIREVFIAGRDDPRDRSGDPSHFHEQPEDAVNVLPTHRKAG
jgi:2-dehydropantoate 2-reductase